MITTDATTGMKTYTAAYQSSFSAATAGGPPSIKEREPAVGLARDAAALGNDV